MGRSSLETLNVHELTLKNALADASIAAAMVARGYTEERLEEGLALVKAAQEAEQADAVADGTKLESTGTLKTLFGEVRKAYGDYRTAARLCFGSAEVNPGPWQSLGLKGTTPRGQDAFIGTALASVNAAVADTAIVDKLATYGFDKKSLEALQANLLTLNAANQSQEDAKGMRKASRADADAKFKAQHQFMSAFKQLARRTLTDAQLTQIGLK